MLMGQQFTTFLGSFLSLRKMMIVDFVQRLKNYVNIMQDVDYGVNVRGSVEILIEVGDIMMARSIVNSWLLLQ